MMPICLKRPILNGSIIILISSFILIDNDYPSSISTYGAGFTVYKYYASAVYSGPSTSTLFWQRKNKISSLCFIGISWNFL